MKKKISVATSLVLILFAILLTFQITYNFVEKVYQKKVDTLTKTQSDFSHLAEADGLIRENFLGAVNEDSLQDGLIKGYISALSDPYSRYLTVDEYRNYRLEQKGTGSGIGARFTYDSKTGEVIVYAVFSSSPAQKSGLRKSDVLYKIGDTLVSDLSFAEAVQMLSGDAGTEVTVTVKRKLAAQVLEMSFTIKREEVRQSTISYEMLSETVGYIQIFDINETTAQEFSHAIDAILASEAKGVVFDVRNNTGDDFDAVCSMLDRLLPKGVIAKKSDHRGEEKTVKSDETYLPLAMSVVMNSSTACAPELFAATLRDFGCATLVGETTYGKAALQTVLEMDDGSALILTTALVSAPKSASFEGVGVIPDVESKLNSENLYLATKEEDNQLQDAIAKLGL